MPHYLIKEKGKTSILVHEAPIDEKTKEIRKKFDVDDETGYPRHYNWRPLAKLGPYYRPEKVFEVFEPQKAEERLSTKVALAGALVVPTGFAHFLKQQYYARPIWSKPLPTLFAYVCCVGISWWLYDQKYNRQLLKNQIYADYMKKHPERFETVHRPKFRECLGQYTPIR